MLSGTDLIKTAGQIQERARRLKAVDNPDVKAVESPSQTKASLDQDTKSALLRFARFINKDGEKKKQAKKAPADKGIPKAYLNQIDSIEPEHRSGGMLNLFA